MFNKREFEFYFFIVDLNENVVLHSQITDYSLGIQSIGRLEFNLDQAGFFSHIDA